MTTSDLTDTFIELADQLAEFRGTHGRFPVQCDATDLHERRLGDFLRVNRRALTLYRRGEREGTVRERVDHLDLVAPGWRTEGSRPGKPRTRISSFEARVVALKRFVNTHETFPSSHSRDSNERRLAKFVVNMKQAKQGRGTATWDATREAMLGREVPGWDLTREDRFMGRIDELRQFVTLTNREPMRQWGVSASLTSAQRHESSLAILVRNTRYYGSPERQRILAEALALAA